MTWGKIYNGTSGSPLASGESLNYLLPDDWNPANTATNKAILCFHGRDTSGTNHGGDAFQQAWSLYDHPRALANAGYAIISANLGGGTTWGDYLQSFDRALDMYNFATGTLGVGAGEYAIMGWSMGGLGALNAARLLATKPKGIFLWTPALDLSWQFATAGYTPSYVPGNANSATLTSNGAKTVTAGTATTWVVNQAIPGTVPQTGTLMAYNGTQPTPWTGNSGGTGGVSYTAWSGSTFTIPASNATTVTVATGAAVVPNGIIPLAGALAEINGAYGLTGVTTSAAQTAAVLSGATVKMAASIPRQWQIKLTSTSTLTWVANGFTMTATGFSTTTNPNDTLTGVSSAGVSVSWSAGAAVTVSYANMQVSLYDPMANTAAFATALTMPVKIVTATDDTVLPYNATPYWVTQINKANVTQYGTPVTGGHNALFPNVPTSVPVNFMNGLSW